MLNIIIEKYILHILTAIYSKNREMIDKSIFEALNAISILSRFPLRQRSGGIAEHIFRRRMSAEEVGDDSMFELRIPLPKKT